MHVVHTKCVYRSACACGHSRLHYCTYISATVATGFFMVTEAKLDGECINSGLDYWNGGIVEWWTRKFLFLF